MGIRAKDSDRVLYRPPVPDFEVEVFNVADGGACIVSPSASPQIALLVEGGATVEDAYAPAGSVFFLPAGTDFLASAPDEKLKVAVARARSLLAFLASKIWPYVLTRALHRFAVRTVL